jgi:SAM-dependent methyltransferase
VGPLCGVKLCLLDPRLSFNQAAETYDRIRPAYPSALFDVLFNRLPLRPHIVEVGPGTGQATRDLLHRGASVHAIELGSAMGAILRVNLRSRALSVSVGDFEQLPGPGHLVDAVFSATAYHWISPDAQLNRPAAILKPGGVLAIVDLVQVHSPDDRGFFEAVQPVYERYGQGHRGPPAPERDKVDSALRQTLASDHRFGNVALHTYDWNQTYSAAEYRLLMLSYSGTQLMQPHVRMALLDDIQTFITERFGGKITRPLVATLTLATLR